MKGNIAPPKTSSADDYNLDSLSEEEDIQELIEMAAERFASILFEQLLLNKKSKENKK